MNTFANKLRSVLPSVVESSNVITQEPPAPLNKEALQVILDYAEEKAQQGFGGVMFFLDGIYEQYFYLEHTNRFYHESTVLDMLETPELGFEIEIEDAGDGTYVKLWWSHEHPFFTTSSVKTIEVTPPEEMMTYLKSITKL
ncbi:MAG: hypothetical protein ACKPFF_11085 [Planktothrix sp.]